MERPTGRTPPRGDCPSSPKGDRDATAPGQEPTPSSPPRARTHAHSPAPPTAQHPPPDRPAPQRPGGGTAPPRESAKQGKGGTGGGQAARARRARKERRHNTARTTAPQHRARWGERPGGKQGTDAGRWAPPPRSTGAAANGRGSGGECPLSRQRRPTGDTGKPTTRDGPREVGHYPPHWGLVRAAARVKRHPQRGELASAWFAGWFAKTQP